MGTAILTARNAASVIALRRLQAPAGGRWQARDSEQHAFQAPVLRNWTPLWYITMGYRRSLFLLLLQIDYYFFFNFSIDSFGVFVNLLRTFAYFV